MKRTDEQKQAFVQQCLEIEKAGGDVLGYIEVNWPSYTPRATWYNLQKQFLCRRQWQLTEGKPKGGESMSKMLEVAQKAMEAVDAGENVFDYLEKAGYKNPSSTWYMLKQHAKKHDQDLYERMAAVAVGRRKPNPAPAKAKPVETPVISPEEAEPVFFGGKAYEKMSGPSPTCCQPAPPSGVTVPDELPEESKPLMIAALMSSVDPDYKYELIKTHTMNDIHMALCWRDKLCKQEHNLIFTPAEWKNLSKEILTALEQFGI